MEDEQFAAVAVTTAHIAAAAQIIPLYSPDGANRSLPAIRSAVLRGSVGDVCGNSPHRAVRAMPAMRANN